VTREQVLGLIALVLFGLYAIGVKFRDRAPDSVRRVVQQWQIGLIASVIFVVVPMPLIFAVGLLVNDPWVNVIWPGFIGVTFFALPLGLILAVVSFVGLTKLIGVTRRSPVLTFVSAPALGALLGVADVVILNRWLWPREPITSPGIAYLVLGALMGGLAAGIFIAHRLQREVRSRHIESADAKNHAVPLV
jgi:hypothetical protein